MWVTKEKIKELDELLPVIYDGEEWDYVMMFHNHDDIVYKNFVTYHGFSEEDLEKYKAAVRDNLITKGIAIYKHTTETEMKMVWKAY